MQQTFANSTIFFCKSKLHNFQEYIYYMPSNSVTYFAKRIQHSSSKFYCTIRVKQQKPRISEAFLLFFMALSSKVGLRKINNKVCLGNNRYMTINRHLSTSSRGAKSLQITDAKLISKLQRSDTSEAFCVAPLELRDSFLLSDLQRFRSSGAMRILKLRD